MRKLRMNLAFSAVALAAASPAAADLPDYGPSGLRAFFSGTSAGGASFNGMLFYLGTGVPGGFITVTINGEDFTVPVTVGEAMGPLITPPTATNGSAYFHASDNSTPQNWASFGVTNISGQIGSTYVGTGPAVADMLNLGNASASFSFGSVQDWGPVTFHFDYAPALPEPATWAMMLLGFGVLGLALRRRRIAAVEIDHAFTWERTWALPIESASRTRRSPSQAQANR